MRGRSDENFENRELIWHFPYYHPEKGYESAPPEIGVADGFVSQTRPASAIRVGRRKLLYFWESGRTELYDLNGDLTEGRPLQQDGAELQTKLLRALENAGARRPTPR
jgi:uncharacterized sulfatase